MQPSKECLELMENLRRISYKDPNYPGQIWFVLEEAAEVQKEVAKISRQKGSGFELGYEMMDLLGAVMMWFYRHGYSPEDVREHLFEKWQRAIDRYNEKGEY